MISGRLAPPKPRLIMGNSGKGWDVSQKTMLELPTNNIGFFGQRIPAIKTTNVFYRLFISNNFYVVGRHGQGASVMASLFFMLAQ